MHHHPSLCQIARDVPLFKKEHISVWDAIRLAAKKYGFGYEKVLERQIGPLYVINDAEGYGITNLTKLGDALFRIVAGKFPEAPDEEPQQSTWEMRLRSFLPPPRPRVSSQVSEQAIRTRKEVQTSLPLRA